MPIQINEPFRGTRGQTCSFTTAFIAKHRSGDESEVAYEWARMEGEIGVILGKKAKRDLPDGDLFYAEKFGGKTVIRAKANKLQLLRNGEIILEDLADPDDFRAYVHGFEMRRVGQKASPVHTNSPSIGSMTDEDAAILFVKTKDRLAAEQGIPIKGANPMLDRATYDAIAKETGYQPKEIEEKIAAYRDSGKKLSALKKKVLADDRVYTNALNRSRVKPPPDVTPPQPPVKVLKKPPEPTPAPEPAPVKVAVPRKASKPVQKRIEQRARALQDSGLEVEQEDLVRIWIKAKETLARDPNNPFTLMSKNQEFQNAFNRLMREWDLYDRGVDYSNVEYAVLKYTRDGKKVSALKKAMIRQGEFEDLDDIVSKIEPDMFPEFRKGDPVDAKAWNDIWDDINIVNPNYGDDQMWGVNCTHVVSTYEMRRRGYRVQAMPRPEGSGRTDQDWLTDRWTQESGLPVRSQWIGSLDAMEAQVERMPEGARGVLTMVWKQGGGHVINWEKVGGKLVFLDAQPMNFYVTAVRKRELFDRFKDQSDVMGPGAKAAFFVRLDDKTPNKRVAELMADDEEHLTDRFPSSRYIPFWERNAARNG